MPAYANETSDFIAGNRRNPRVSRRVENAAPGLFAFAITTETQGTGTAIPQVLGVARKSGLFWNSELNVALRVSIYRLRDQAAFSICRVVCSDSKCRARQHGGRKSFVQNIWSSAAREPNV
jgi:hypothetical protein